MQDRELLGSDVGGLSADDKYHKALMNYLCM